ncbi:MAG: adenylyl-sulfate kinase [Rhodospirillaceae bacterium]|jgi:bifunctional enzyme CysN/CysC|nr:adenylyl-sulfate kinase [Rhodospirillaceae bacterium]MBT5245321.1 adenylyl-sulfate kinase [Rhodospirillaceae bacterium]MBT5561206.1 adenylyl-sulfate kinase [Rhodospirillaceae bacterium]MBT6242742.1 adenylyl-sulfate kinase [Rhodospirillaceae bacterium]MBT7137288.1 adenylyl-sulfate kinase [Rhodospirillaceae bacterium]
MSQEKIITSTNIHAVEHRVAVGSRWRKNGHRGGVLWLTGLSGSGKSTLAMELEQALHYDGYQVYVLDGDNVRGGLNADLGFSPDDRAENIRRIGEVAALFADAGVIVITAFISPYREDRELARSAGEDQFHEIFIEADLDTCEKRDPKGLYKKARRGEIPEFTGISAPYEEPENPALTINTSQLSVQAGLDVLLDYIEENFAEKQVVDSAA